MSNKEKTKKQKKKQFWTDFKGFISKGNVVDLAVALVIGTAFNKIVSQLVDSFINPLISIFIGGFNLNDWKYVYKQAEYNEAGELLKAEVAFTYGTFIQTVIDFLIIALTVFIVVKLYAKLKKHFTEEGTKLYYELHPEELEAKKKAEAEAKRKEEEAKKHEEEVQKREKEQQAEIERLKKEKEQMHWDYMQRQEELLTQIRDILATK